LATELPTYLTVWGDLSPQEVGKHAAYKLHIGLQDADAAGAAVGRARQLVGPNIPLMLDAWMKWDIETTLRVAEQVRPLGVDWIEEPLSPDDLAGYAVLRDRCPVPIAGGEHEFTTFGFAPLIEQRLHRVLQPDVCWCGGLTQLINIYRLAHAAGLRVCPHRGAELWALPALAALDPQPLAESGRPWLPWVGGQPPIRDGVIAVPDEPGFGVVIDEAKLPVR
jgi:L-rhamnonate dehydratase